MFLDELSRLRFDTEAEAARAERAGVSAAPHRLSEGASRLVRRVDRRGRRLAATRGGTPSPGQGADG